MVNLASRDLQYRGWRDDRISSFHHKQNANFLLYQRVVACSDSHEYDMLRQSWDTLNRPKYEGKPWHDKQLKVFQLVHQALSYDDEEQKRKSQRWLYVCGPPGSGKSAVILEAALRCIKMDLQVLIVCPTGTNVYQE